MAASSESVANAERLNANDFLDHLLQRELLNDVQAHRLRAANDGASGGLVKAISALGLIPDDELARQVAEYAGLPHRTAQQLSEPVSIEDISERFLRSYRALFISGPDGIELVVADPFDEPAIDALRFAAGGTIEQLCVTSVSAINLALDRTQGKHLAGLMVDVDADASQELDGRHFDLQSPVAEYARSLVASAMERNASDIHIEPGDGRVDIRLRVDGALSLFDTISAAAAKRLVNRYKILADLDVAEDRLPQDGKIEMIVAGVARDIRIATSPTSHGEAAVLRILGRGTVPLKLDQLGLDAASRERLLAALAKPHGVILLTGPTGSGKTTTLYAALNHLNRPDLKLLSVEDPVEIAMDGVTQVQVHPAIGLTYAHALRAFLRQDPDILMIGEIRDPETASIAMRAAMTGHLVLSTLHTNSAAEARDRLSDLGVDDYLVRDTLLASVAQRLVRKLCEHCASERPTTEAEFDDFRRAGMEPPEQIREASGCDACYERGYAGRLPIAEVILFSEGEADAEGRSVLGQKALGLVAEGRIAFAEYQRITG